jgi:hypothetical protein
MEYAVKDVSDRDQINPWSYTLVSQEEAQELKRYQRALSINTVND